MLVKVSNWICLIGDIDCKIVIRIDRQHYHCKEKSLMNFVIFNICILVNILYFIIVFRSIHVFSWYEMRNKIHEKHRQDVCYFLSLLFSEGKYCTLDPILWKTIQGKFRDLTVQGAAIFKNQIQGFAISHLYYMCEMKFESRPPSNHNLSLTFYVWNHYQSLYFVQY